MQDKETIIIRNEDIRTRVLGIVARLPLDKPYQIEVKPFKHKRSNGQNALFHKWVSILAQHTGYSDFEMKEYLKVQFLTPQFIQVRDKSIVSRHTSKLDTKEMSEFMNKVMAFAVTELNITLPSPQDLGWE